MNSPDPLTSLREALAYINGLEAAAQLSPEQKTQQILNKLLPLLEDMANELVNLRKRQSNLEDRIADRGLQNADRERRTSEVPQSAIRNPQLMCPSCQRELNIPDDLWAKGSFEIACPRCAQQMEVR